MRRPDNAHRSLIAVTARGQLADFIRSVAPRGTGAGEARGESNTDIYRGTSHVARTTLDAKAKNITVVIQNSGYRAMAR